MSTHHDDPALAAERAHSTRSHEALRRMREQTADWQQAAGGDSVSTAALKRTLHRRMESLEQDPDTPLFFGRLDYATALGAELDEACHVGRRHVTGEVGGAPLVIDWRAPLSLPFYRAHAADPMGVAKRRRFGFQHGEMTAYEDEDFTTGKALQAGEVSALLETEIERPRTGPMRDIVATIQPDQDLLVRTGLATSMAIQGAPGTGKTAVGLHRAAYLLYAFRETLTRQGVLVLGPNANFLRHIGEVLPALGEIDVQQETIDSLVAGATGLEASAVNETSRAVLLGDARMAELCARAVWGHVSEPERTLEVAMGTRVWRVPPHHLTAAVAQLRSRGVRYLAGRAMLPQRLAHQVLLRMEVSGAVTDDRVQRQVARSKDVKAMTNELWPALTVPKLTHQLLTDPELLACCAEGLFTEQEQELLLAPRRTRSPRQHRWSAAEVVLADEVADLLNRTRSLGHVIIDEAQDLSAMQLRAAGRRATTGSVTLLGDLAQATTAWASSSWAESLAHLGHPEATVQELVEGFRVPGLVLELASRLLPTIAPQLSAPRSVRHNRGMLEFRRVNDLGVAVVEQARALSAREGTLGIIVADSRAEAAVDTLVRAGVLASPSGTDEPSRLGVVPARLAKGLEFDHVLLVEPAEVVAAEADRLTGLRRLYVCLTRCVSSLVVLHREALPDELA